MSVQEKQLHMEVKELREKLQTLSMTSDYVEYVKVERKIHKNTCQIDKLKESKGQQNLLIKYVVPYGAQALLCLTLLVIATSLRRRPVIVFDKEFNFTPFSIIMRYPTSIENAISVPFWIGICCFVSRSIASFI